LQTVFVTVQPVSDKMDRTFLF